MNITITPEQMDCIVAKGLAEDLYWIEKDLEHVHETKKGRVYSVVYEEDVKQLQAVVDAYKLVLSHYEVAK